MSEIRYSYKPKVISLLLAALVAGAISVGIGYIGYSNDQGLVINGILELPREQATFFFYALAAVCGFGFLIALWGVYVGATSRNELVLTDRALLAPKGWGSKVIAIDYGDISEVSLLKIQDQDFFRVVYDGKKKVDIYRSMLPDREAFENVVANVSGRVG